MNHMSQPMDAVSPGANSPWAGIGVLCVVLISLLSALYFVQTREEDLRHANTREITLAPVVLPRSSTGAPASGVDKKPTTTPLKHAAPGAKGAAP